MKLQSITSCVSTCLSFGVIAENRSKMVAILNFKMAATRGHEYVGGIFFQLPLGGSTPVQSFMLASKTERFWCFAALLYRPNLLSMEAAWLHL